VSVDQRDRFFDVGHLENDLGARVGRSALIVLVFALLKLVFAVGTTAILARLIPPPEHGLIALAIPAVLIATGFSEFGLAQAVVQRSNVTHRLASALFWVNASLGATLSVAVFALGEWAAIFYNTPEVVSVFQVLSPYVFFAVLNTQYIALLRRQMRVALIEWVNAIAMVVAATLAIVMALAGFGVEALIAQLLVVQALALMLLFVYTRWVPSGPWVLMTEPLREILTYGGYLAAERVLDEISRNLQFSIIGRFFSPLETGLYYRADALAQMPQRRVMSPLSAAFIPALSRLQHDTAGLRYMLRRQISRTNLIVIPLGATLTGAADLIIALLLGPDWSGAVPILAFFGIFVAATATQSCMAWTMVAIGASRPLFFFRLVNVAAIFVVVLLAVTFDADLISLTAAYVLTSAVAGTLHLSLWLFRASSVGGRCILICLVDTFCMTIALIGGAATVRWFTDLSPLNEVIIAMTVIFMITLLRVGMWQDTRTDIRKVLRWH
jgi:PST family polysaccharide transporter